MVGQTKHSKVAWQILRATRENNTTPFALAIIEDALPRVSGFELAKKMHNLNMPEQTPVIIISSDPIRKEANGLVFWKWGFRIIWQALLPTGVCGIPC